MWELNLIMKTRGYRPDGSLEKEGEEKDSLIDVVHAT